MEKRELEIDLKLDQKLSKYLDNYIDQRFQFMQWATIEQKKDLLGFIIYLERQYADYLPPKQNGFIYYEIIASNAIHDMKGIVANDPHFLPKSYGYNKTISITKL
tara:strand:- start:184 stop:498 length:315 start_codon:yes stop_codon:yes gene_type:complete